MMQNNLHSVLREQRVTGPSMMMDMVVHPARNAVFVPESRSGGRCQVPGAKYKRERYLLDILEIGKVERIVKNILTSHHFTTVSHF
jgi:hypothetical protein